jgi:hypothetical protein
MALKKAADLLVDVLAESGVRRFAQRDHGLDSCKETNSMGSCET